MNSFVGCSTDLVRRILRETPGARIDERVFVLAVLQAYGIRIETDSRNVAASMPLFSSMLRLRQRVQRDYRFYAPNPDHSGGID